MKLLPERIAHVFKLRPSLDDQVGLGKAAGASKSVVNQWMSGNIQSMRIDYALNLERSLGIDHIWLMLGEGEPEKKDGIKLTADEAAFLAVYRRLEPRDRGTVLRMAEVLANESELAQRKAS